MEGPLGQFWFRQESSRPALLIAGGTGYAPLRAMLESLLPTNERRAFHLYWGVRTIEHLYEQERLREWTERFANFRFTPVLSEPTSEWAGKRGFVHTAVLDDHPNMNGFDVYAAGPPIMIETIRRELVARGLPADRLFFDSFDFAPDALAKLASKALS